MAQSRVEDQVGRVFGDRYRLVGLIGSGGSGYVFLATDDRLERQVAVKLLHTGLASDDAFLRRFRAEARGAAALSHPHIMGVLDWGEEADGPYLVLEHLGGGSLRDLLDSGRRLSVEQTVRVGLEAAGGLAYAHRRGVVHRDVKPANLLFDEDGRLSIADFGLARALAEAAWTEPMGALIGTVRYSSPEAAQGNVVDGRADVYALGLVLIEALSGTVPFGSDTPLSTLMARVAAPPAIPPSAGPLRPVLAEMTQVSPDERFDSQSVLSALESLAGELPRPAPLPLVRRGVDDDTTAPLLVPAGGLAGPPPASAGGLPGPPPAPPATAGLAAPAEPGGPSPADAARRPAAGPAARPRAADPAGRPRAAEPGRRRRLWPWLLALLVALLVAAGAVLGARVLLYVPSYHTPDLSKLSPAQALVKLKPDGFHLAEGAPAYSPSVPPGEVVSQSPGTGALLKRGSTVHVRVSKGPQPVAVPRITGLTKALALARLKSNGLVPKVANSYSESVDSGDVISYSPSTGAHLPGTTVDVTVSAGPKPRVVPSFASGTTYGQAVSALQGMQLKAKRTTAYSDSVNAGDVIGSSPAAGASVPRGSEVTLTVSLGPHMATVPYVYGQTGAAASQQLNNDGFKAQVFGPDLQGGSVVLTNPSPGESVHYGSTVDVFVL
ncbi:MAG: PASTA domain-containing protein [Acidimicrobiales bacterium]